LATIAEWAFPSRSENDPTNEGAQAKRQTCCATAADMLGCEPLNVSQGKSTIWSFALPVTSAHESVSLDFGPVENLTAAVSLLDTHYGWVPVVNELSWGRGFKPPARAAAELTRH